LTGVKITELEWRPVDVPLRTVHRHIAEVLGSRRGRKWLANSHVPRLRGAALGLPATARDGLCASCNAAVEAAGNEKL
jgi:hypothetical protein